MFHSITHCSSQAHFYYVLATHLEAERVRDLLDTSKTAISAEARSVVASAAPSVSASASADASQNFASLLRISRAHVEGNDLVVSTSSSSASSSSSEGVDDPSLPLSLDLSLDASVAEALTCPRLYALHVAFAPADPLLALAPASLTVPTLALGETARRTLRVTPRVPLPTSLLVRAEFNDAAGHVHAVTLAPITLTFSDLLAPLSFASAATAPPSQKSSPSTPPSSSPSPLSPSHFESLWASCLASELGAVSVRVLAIERALALRRIDVLWRPFIVDCTPIAPPLALRTLDPSSSAEEESLTRTQTPTLILTQHRHPNPNSKPEPEPEPEPYDFP
jgi:hypothetical protein